MPQIVSKNPVYEDFGFGLKFIYVCADFHISICFCLIWKRDHVRLIFLATCLICLQVECGAICGIDLKLK